MRIGDIKTQEDVDEYSRQIDNAFIDSGIKMRRFIDFVAEYLQPPGLWDNSGRKRPNELSKKEAIKTLEAFQKMAIDVLNR